MVTLGGIEVANTVADRRPNTKAVQARLDVGVADVLDGVPVSRVRRLIPLAECSLAVGRPADIPFEGRVRASNDAPYQGVG